MPNLKDIRNRIQSVKNTQQITRAMKMVSAAKLRRAQMNIQNLRPYAKQLLSVIADVATTHRVQHPLLSTNTDPKKVLLVVLTSDRGLAGGFNNNINRFAYKFYQDNKSKYEKMDFLFKEFRYQFDSSWVTDKDGRGRPQSIFVIRTVLGYYSTCLARSTMATAEFPASTSLLRFEPPCGRGRPERGRIRLSAVSESVFKISGGYKSIP